MEPSYGCIVDQALPILIQYPSNMAETISSERRRLEFRLLGSLEVSTANAAPAVSRTTIEAAPKRNFFMILPSWLK